MVCRPGPHRSATVLYWPASCKAPRIVPVTVFIWKLPTKSGDWRTEGCHAGKVHRGCAAKRAGGGYENYGINPMNQSRVMAQLTNVRAAPRCGAKTRAGGCCQCPAIRERNRCRLHGGRSTGAPKGRANGNFVRGEFTAEAIQERQWLRSVVRTYGKVEKG